MLILGEASVFTLLFGCFLYSRAKAIDLFAQSEAELNSALGVTNTVLLLTSSWLVARAVTAVRQGYARASGLFGAAALCGVGFIGTKAAEYHELISNGFTAFTNPFFSFYFAITALHLLHVVIGLIILLALRTVSRRPFGNPRQLMLVESGGCYWHMVDLIWIILFPIFYLIA